MHPHPAAAATPSPASLALQQMARGDWAGARANAERIHDPVLDTMYQWLLYREQFTGLPFGQISAFLRRHPQWPEQDNIRASAERNMDADYPAAEVLSWYQEHPPVTAGGLKRYADTLTMAGRQDAVPALLKDRWPVVTSRLDMQAAVMQSYGRLISKDTNRRRLDNLLFHGDDTTARSFAALLGPDYVALAAARSALARGDNKAPQLVARVSSGLARDPGLLYERLRWRRKADDDQGAADLLNQQPPIAAITNPADWWKERSFIARRLVSDRDYRGAYRLAAAHGQVDGQDYADAEWLAGWLQLRFLNDPAKAAGHFNNMYGAVTTSISKARGAYWLGRTAEAMDQPDEALRWYRLAAQQPKVYYGQLAALKLPGSLREYRPVSVLATSVEKAQMNDDELVRAIRFANDAGLDTIRRKLINAKAATIERPSDFKALTEILTGLGLRGDAVRVAKKAASQNIFLDTDAYPKLSQYFGGINVDMALAHSVIRQESEYDQYARSPTGALGLMQLMPATAAWVAKKESIPYRDAWLTSKPEENIRLGSAYLNRLLATYNGSYPLVLAAYNAGGGRVNQWLRDNGDPRAGQVDWVDWIELIPIYETRNYVQRVMESYVVYNEYMGMRRR